MENERQHSESMRSGVMQPGFKFQLCHVQVAIPQKYKLPTQVHKGNLLSCHRWLFRLICYEGMGGASPGPFYGKKVPKGGEGSLWEPQLQTFGKQKYQWLSI